MSVSCLREEGKHPIRGNSMVVTQTSQGYFPEYIYFRKMPKWMMRMRT
jgi:hypothetical protein